MNNQEIPVEFEITGHIGSFSPILFIYLREIAEIDVSGCRSIDSDLFVDCIIFCENLKKIEMRSCWQFEENDFVKMLPKMRKLSYVDIAKCCKITSVSALYIAASMCQVLWLNFDPKDAKSNVSDWEILLRNFPEIHFGHNVRVHMPFYGNNWRIPWVMQAIFWMF